MTHTPRRTIRMSDAEWTAGHTKAQSQGETITEVLRRLLAGYLVDNASGLDYGVEYRAVPKDADSSLAVLQSAESRTLKKVGMIPGYSMWPVAVLEALREAGWELVKLPEPTTEPVEDEDRPKMPGDYLKRDDTKSEVWIEGLPDEPPYVFFGHRGMGPSYFPAEFARDVAAALLAAAKDADA